MKENINKQNLKEFGIIFGMGMPLIIGWILPFFTGHTFRIWTLWLGIPIFFLGIFSPKLLFRPYQLWMRLGFLLGWLNSRIILGIVFVFVLIPISLIMKIFGHDPLRKIDSKKNTYREIKQISSINMNRIF